MTAAVRGIPVGGHPGSLQRRSLQTLLATVLLTGLYALYSQFVSPLVSPPAFESLAEASEKPVVPQPRKNREIAEKHLEEAPWAAKAMYQLRTENAFVYAQTSEPNHAENAILFTPFAVVWTQKGKQENEEPYVIISDKAYIKFANSFEDLSNPNPGRVIGGTLEGEVKILGPDGLKVLGKDFWFSEASMSIWCDHQVQFAQGPHRGSALGLDAELIPDEIARAKEKLAVAGVRSVRLRQNVVMDLLFEAGNERKQPTRQHELQGTQIAQHAPKEKKEPVKVRIQSRGSFTFGVETHLGTFVDDVRVYRPTEPGKYDTLFSDKLTLIFEPENPIDTQASQDSAVATEKLAVDNSSKTGRSEEQIDPDHQHFQNFRSDLYFRSLHAEGSSVVLISQSNDLNARMTDLVYDSQTKEAVMSDANSVRVQQGLNGENEIHSPVITLNHDQEGKVSTIWCNGKGWLRSVDAQSGQQKLIARWDKQMRKYPDQKTELDIVDLENNATLIQPEQQVSLSAEFIRFWVKRNDEPDNRPSDSKRQSDSQFSKSNKTKGRSDQYQLKRFVAVKNVTMDNKDMHARTKRLVADFEQDLSGPRNPNPFIGIGNNRHPRTTGEIRQSQAGSSTNPLRERSRPKSKKRSSQKGPMDVTADSIRVRILQGENQQQAKIAEVWTNGNVIVRQSRTPGEAPLVMTGNEMHVVNRNDDDQLIHVLGKPAHIRDPTMHIEGEKIHLDRGGNLAWVEGEGLLQLPVKKSLEGKKLDQTQLLNIWWSEQMKFDGETAQFFGDVRTILDNHHVNCQEMVVLMTKRFSFTDENSDDEAEISRVICKDNVDFKSREYEGNQLVGLRRGRFVDFTMDQLTGETTGAGPGWITSWKRGRGNRAGLIPNATVKANSPLKPDAKNWEYLRIDFSGKMNGNTKSRTTQFHDQVQIVYGPVLNPLDVLDPDNLPKDGGWMRSDKLRVTQNEIKSSLKSVKKPSSYIDMQAEGNAKLKGREFHARASFINYDESKGIYILRSLAPRKATIWRQTKFGGKRSPVEAQQMIFWPARNDLKLDGVTEFQGFK